MIHAERQDLDQDDDQERGSSAASRANLRSWTPGDPRAVEASRLGVEGRRRRAEARRLADAEPIAHLEAIASTVNRDQLGPMAAAAAVHMIGEVVSGRQKVRDPAAWVRVLVDVARLEAGEVTSAVARVDVTAEDIARAVALRDAARRALGPVIDVDDDE
jgi:hypothetical protein